VPAVGGYCWGVATPPATIDLGELPRDGSIELGTPAWRWRTRVRPWRVRNPWRAAGVAVAIVAALAATMAGSATIPGPALTHVFTAPGSTFVIGQDRLYVVDAVAPGGTITAYRLADGAILWQRSWAAPGLQLSTWQGLLLARTVLSDETEHTSRLDPDTGRPLWISDGRPTGYTGERLFLERPLHDARPFDPPYVVTAVNPYTGDPGWVRQLSGWSAQTMAGSPERVVALTDQGTLVAYDPATGEPIGSVATASSPEQADPSVAGPVVLLHDRVQSGFAVAAYDLATLAPSWTMSDPVAEIGPCGALLCLHGPDPPRAVDPGTGRTMWTADWLPTGQSGWFVVRALATPALEGHLVVTLISGADFTQSHSWLVDAVTGEQVLDLRRWTFPWDSGPSLAEVGLVRYENGTAWIGRLRPDRSGVDVLGSVTYALDWLDVPGRPDVMDPECAVSAGHVACSVRLDETRREVTVWRIRSG
jgi:putative pyrroloquinoline-quinone binding quinoprotein